MQKEQIEMEKEPAWTMKKLLRAKRFRRALIIVCGLQICQQLSGINVVSAFVLFFLRQNKNKKENNRHNNNNKNKSKNKKYMHTYTLRYKICQ